jgi:signal transduction histidine kinase
MVAESRAILLSAQPASYAQCRIALSVSFLLLVIFIATLPFAWIHGPPVPTLIAVLHAVLAINDLITAVLLFGQYLLAPSLGLNILAGGYLFTALISIPYLLSFPGVVFEPPLVYGDRSAPWLFVAWHGMLSAAIIAYACLPVRSGAQQNNSGGPATIAGTALIVVAAVASLMWLATAGRDWLPLIGVGRQYSTPALAAIDGLAVLSLLALLLLARHRPYNVLDLWLMVVMFAWLCSVTLGAVIGTIRYDIGYDVSRVFAVLASVFVLAILLSQISVLNARAISDRERRLNEMEAVLVHAARVNELGHNLSSLIHEVNQPLTAIANYSAASIQLVDTSEPERLKHLLQRLAEQVGRATAIVRRLRDFIARHDTDRQTENLPELLRDAVRLAVVGTTEPTPNMELRGNPAASWVFCDRIQVEQVIFNLVRNAIEAMSGSERRVLSLGTDLTANGMVEVSIADTGPGLSPEIRAKLFEPFTTTKAGGLGIGLSICRVIIEAHGGQLEAEDDPGGGTIFRFTLPRSPMPSEKGERSAPLSSRHPEDLVQNSRS